MKDLISDFIKQKKGNAAIFILILSLVAVFAFIMISLFSYKALSEINTEVQNDPLMNNESKELLDDLNDRYPATFDALSVLIVALLWIVVMVISFFTDTHPIFFVFFFLIVVFLLIIGGIFSNTWDEIKADEADIVVGFPKTNFIMDNYLLFIGIIGFSGLAAMFIKNRLVG